MLFGININVSIFIKQILTSFEKILGICWYALVSMTLSFVVQYLLFNLLLSQRLGAELRVPEVETQEVEIQKKSFEYFRYCNINNTCQIDNNGKVN